MNLTFQGSITLVDMWLTPDEFYNNYNHDSIKRNQISLSNYPVK